MGNFIPQFHFEHPSKKLKPEWCQQAINQLYFQRNNKSLLADKDVDEIEKFSSGNFSMTPFKRMFKSLKKKEQRDLINKTNFGDKQLNDNNYEKGIDWTPLPLIPNKLNSAVAIIQKIPVEISCTAVDPLAAQKREEDVTFLKNKPILEEELKDIADQMQIPKVDLGATKHSSIPFSESPYGFDLNEPDQLDVFQNLLYNLGVETAYETALQAFYDIKKAVLIKGLEILDHYKFGVSVNRPFESKATGLPDLEYVYPDNLECPESKLQDYSDNTHRFLNVDTTPLEIMNSFDITQEQMDKIINDKDTGYARKNGGSMVDAKNWDTYKVRMVYCEVKTIDWVGIVEKKNSKKGFKSFTMDEKEATSKVWAQNTYSFWWLKDTGEFFDIQRLGFAHRTKGNESIQNFTTNIFRSQKKSAVELCIGENKKAQMAELKLQHAIIMSKPSGSYIDLKYLRGALSGLKEQGADYTIDDLIALAFEENRMIGDTEGFEGKADASQAPFQDIVGGLKYQEIQGYMQIIVNADQNISSYTGINTTLTGQSANPDALIGVEKLRINAGLNALYYCNEAITYQHQAICNVWSTIIKNAIERGGATRKGVESIVGSRKANIIDKLDQLPNHTMAIKYSIKQREEEREELRREIERLKYNGVLNSSDVFLINNVSNPKDKYALIAIREKQFLIRRQQEMERGYQQQQQMKEQEGVNQVQSLNAQNEGDIKLAYAKGDVQSKILELANHLGLKEKQFEAVIKKALQQDRAQGQTNKSLATLREKSNLQQQEAGF